MNVAVSQVVRSRAGRDAGRNFIVVDVLDEVYVLICDGVVRKIEKPKKKKIKHLIVTDIIFEHLEQVLIKNLKVTNSDIRKALKILDTINIG